MRTTAAATLGSLVTVLAALAGSSASGQEVLKAPDVAPAIDRGLAFLAKDALAWKAEHECASCHHAALVAWSMREAKLSGFAVDEPVLADMTKWVAESGDGKTSLARPADRPKAFNSKALFYALALSGDPQPDATVQAGLKRLLGTVLEDQTDDGSWSAWPDTRPPIFGPSDEVVTVSAALALLPAANAGDAPAAAARDRAVQWLASTKSDDDPQSVTLRLVLWQRLGRPAAELEPLAGRIRERQNADGGWSQAAGMASDAWATGQALYALAHAGYKSDDPAVARGQAFLAQTQRPDGGWAMTSRPAKPGDAGAKNLIPITGAGSAWAVLGLVRSR
jgi:hypothetical protein